MKLSKIAFAVASTLVIASGAAFAGQIGSSSVTIASEVIKTDAQIVRAPSNVYSFSGDINAQTNQQLLQLQYTLTAGTWSANVFPTVNTLVALAPTATSMLKVNYQDAANAAQTTFPAGTIINGFVTADRKTLVFNVNIPNGAGAAPFLLKTPSFTINASAGNLGAPATAAVDNAGISGLFTVVGQTGIGAGCLVPDKNLDISFKHFTTHNSNTDLIANASPDAEHLRVGSTNTARFMNFVQNQVFTFVPAAQTSRTDANFQNQRLNGTNFTVVAPSATANGFANALPAIAAPQTRHYFGRVNLVERARGVDLNYSGAYGAVTTPAVAPLVAGDFAVNPPATGATLTNGVIELANTTNLTVTLPTALPVGTQLTLADGTGAPIAGVTQPAATTAGQTTVVFTFTTAAAIAAAGAANTVLPAVGPVGGAHIFGVFPGTNVISQVGGITVAGNLIKSPNLLAAALDVSEQNLSCSGPLAGIGGGIKIDIRNYASAAKFGTAPGSFASYVRLINNSESATADIFAQLIYADGTYGPYGALPALAPRAVANYSNVQLEALLNTTPAATNPFGTNTVYTNTQGATVVNRGVAGIGDRVRFISNTGTTLRVQSFMLLPTGNLLDTTNAQGVDFENSGDRVPTTAVDAQPVSQDAINGLAR